MSVLNNKPVFTLDIEASDVSFFVNLNGVAAYNEYDHSGQATLKIPVNQLMHPKENTLSIDVVPPKMGAPFKDNARVKVNLSVHSSGKKEESYRISSLVFDSQGLQEGEPNKGSFPSGHYSFSDGLEKNPEGDIVVGDIVATPDEDYEGSVVYKQKLTIPNALPLWAFFDSDSLPDYFTIPDDEYYPVLEDLLKEYLKIQKALETGDIESVISMFEERNRETDLAYYREPGTTEERIRESLKDSAENDNLELVDLTSEHVNILPEENGKIVSLVRPNMKSAIALNFIEGQGAVRYPLFFRREDGEWILTR